MELRLRLAAEPESPALARQVLDETFGSWGCEEHTDDARIVVTELVSNAVLHARTDLELALELRPTQLRIAVTDRAGGDVIMRKVVALDHTGGRGLAMVDVLADEWGVEYGMAESHPSKTVWAAWHLPR